MFPQKLRNLKESKRQIFPSFIFQSLRYFCFIARKIIVDEIDVKYHDFRVQAVAVQLKANLIVSFSSCPMRDDTGTLSLGGFY